MAAVSLDGDVILLRLVLQPKASRDQIVGLHGDELKVAITAPPIDGKANAHLIKFLAKLCKTAKSNVSIDKGELSKHKVVRIAAPGKVPDELAALLTQ